jgi:F-type H+-transporting ATPase subunit b
MMAGRAPRRGACAWLAVLAIAVLAAWPLRLARAEAEEPAHAVAAEGAAGEGVANAEKQKGEGEGEGKGKEGEHAPAINGKSLALQLLNFGVLLAILIKFGGGAINKALAARHEQLKAEVAAAAAARTQAEEQLRKQEARLAGLEREITAMRAGIKQEAEVEKAQLIAAAEDRARRVREETLFAIEQQVKEAQISLRRDVAEQALRIAEEILRRAVDANDQRRMLETFMNEVAGPLFDASDASDASGAPGVVGKAV